MSSNLHLRNIDPLLMNQLKYQAAQRQTSINTLILDLLKQSLGLTSDRKSMIYNDLDRFSGTWSAADEKEFLESISPFGTIDEDLWK